MKKFISIFLVVFLLFIGLVGCGNNAGYSTKDPVVLTIWHRYNGEHQVALNELIAEFNSTVGGEKGIQIEAFSKGSDNDILNALRDSANKEVGAENLPDIFTAYIDTVLELDQMGIVANLDDYFTADEKAEYVEDYLEEGMFVEGGPLKSLPINKSSEALFVYKAAWTAFKEDTGATDEDLATWESIAKVSEAYFDWSDGKAMFGRDALANYLLLGSKQLGAELFSVIDGELNMDLDTDMIRQLWSNYYVPYMKGHYTAVGKFRSDDMRTGKLIAYVGSTSSAAFFPTDITI